jgi:hypothetical protein
VRLSRLPKGERGTLGRNRMTVRPGTQAPGSEVVARSRLRGSVDICFFLLFVSFIAFFSGVFRHLSMRAKKSVRRVCVDVWDKKGTWRAGPMGTVVGAFGHRDGSVLSEIEVSPRYYVALQYSVCAPYIQSNTVHT